MIFCTTPNRLEIPLFSNLTRISCRRCQETYKQICLDLQIVTLHTREKVSSRRAEKGGFFPKVFLPYLHVSLDSPWYSPVPRSSSNRFAWHLRHFPQFRSPSPCKSTLLSIPSSRRWNFFPLSSHRWKANPFPSPRRVLGEFIKQIYAHTYV